MSAVGAAVGELMALNGVGRIFGALLDHALERYGDDAAKSMFRILVQRIGPQVARGEIDQYEAGRAVADAVETVKFGPAK